MKICFWCKEEIRGRFAIDYFNGEQKYFHVTVAPLGKDCHNEWLQALYDLARDKVHLYLATHRG